MGDLLTPEANVIPEDLSDRAIKLARRIQALDNDGIYCIIIVKQKNCWSWRLEGEDEKVEVAQ